MDAAEEQSSTQLRQGLTLAGQILLVGSIALAGLWTIITLSGDQDSPDQAEAATPVRAGRTLSAPRPRHASPPALPRAVILVVSSEAAKESLLRHTETETLIRAITGESLRQTWVVVVPDDESLSWLVDAVQSDNGLDLRSTVASVEVVDLR